MASFVNACVFTAASAGTGSFVVSAALTGWMTPATAGAVDGATYRYRAYSNDLTQWEIGTGTYTSSTTTLTRTVTASSNGGSTVNFTAAPVVALTSFGADISSSVEITGGTITGLTNLSSSVATISGTSASKFVNTTDSSSVLVLRVEGDRATPAQFDTAYQAFYMSDAAGTQAEFARISARASNITAGAVDGRLILGGTAAGVLTNSVQVTNNSIAPFVSGASSLGFSTAMWQTLWLNNSGSINFNNGDVTVTHSTNALAFAGASSGYSFDAAVLPSANDAAALGSASVSWSDLFLAAGGVINFDNGDTTITDGTNTLDFAGATSGYRFDSLITPLANDGAALGSATVSFSDLFLASGGVINFNNGDVTLTHSADALTFAGAASGYTFSDGGVVLGAATGGNKGAGTINATTVYKNNVPIGWTLVGTLTTTSGTTQTQTAIPSGYRAFYIELEGVSFTAAATLNVAVSTDNTNFGTTVNIATALTAATNTVSGTLWIYGVSETSATGKSVVPITNMDAAATMFTTISRIQASGAATGAITAVRFAGGTFDAGTIRIYGVA